ncbi:hypothetical protein [Streptomyces sp. NPDC050759]|uniref:hypothetical protein n=1 Tax=Streptomyces sp. NPDC050759 TaxID=3365635 RepID=UPI0037AEAA68
MLVMLTATGVTVGLVVWKVPGHAGPDPATTGLDTPVRCCELHVLWRNLPDALGWAGTR